MSKFTWGDTIRVKQNAPPKFEAGKIGSVCSVNLIETDVHANHTGAEVGEYSHTVEWIDGSDIEIPAKWLEKA